MFVTVNSLFKVILLCCSINLTVIDHGVSSRGHRQAIYSDNGVYLGIAWYTHLGWCVTSTADFAPAEFISKMKDDNIIFEYVSIKK